MLRRHSLVSLVSQKPKERAREEWHAFELRCRHEASCSLTELPAIAVARIREEPGRMGGFAQTHPKQGPGLGSASILKQVVQN